jgi:hypothetical protein
LFKVIKMSQLTTLLTKSRDALLESRALLVSHPRARYILAALPAAVIALLIPSAYRDYQSYLALGPGGPPYNVLGWLGVKLVFNPFKRDMFGTEMYDRKIALGERTGFLKDLPRREGDRPRMGSFAVPQRQIDQVPSQEIKDVCTRAMPSTPFSGAWYTDEGQKLMAEYGAFLTRNKHIIDRVPSILEKYTDAAHVCHDIELTAVAAQMKREICHVHGTSDHSVHVTLAPADCKHPA